MLEVCPSKRPSAEELLGHEFFKDCPPMVELPFDDFTDEFSAVDIEKNYHKKAIANPLLQLLTMLITELKHQLEAENLPSESNGMRK